VTGEYFAIKFVRRSEHVDDNDDNQPLVENQDAHKLHEVFKDFRREIDILKVSVVRRRMCACSDGSETGRR